MSSVAARRRTRDKGAAFVVLAIVDFTDEERRLLLAGRYELCTRAEMTDVVSALVDKLGGVDGETFFVPER